MFILNFALGGINVKFNLHSIVTGRTWTFLHRALSRVRLLEQVLGYWLKILLATRNVSSRKTHIIGYYFWESEKSELEEKLWRDILGLQWRLITDKLNANLRGL
jgi:hypothetical protein